jgi:glyoxylase-like metal-dependent hydrolase (beta-lactamase superfamily II)
MLKQLTNRVYYKPHVEETDRPTLGLISGDKYSLLVDAGNSPNHAMEFLQDVKQINTTAPVKFLVITHWHWDHTFGIHTMDLPTISHVDTKKQLDYMKTLKWDDVSLDLRVETGEEIEFCRDMIKREMPTRDELILQSPDITFTDRIEIDLGGITCVIEHVGGVHAQDSSIVYIPEEKIMFLGDCLCQDFYSGDWSYDRDELHTLIEKIRKYDVDYYVTSHHRPETNEELWTYLTELRDLGEIVGDETDWNKIKDVFIKTKAESLDEEKLDTMQYFVNGNKKRKKINDENVSFN